jgi:hypothetical protein
VSQWATDNKLQDQMTATASLIAPQLTSYQKAESQRTIKWVGKQQKRIADALKRNCELDEKTGLVTECKAVNG